VRIQFTVPAIPVAQPRQRHAMIGGHVRNYTPSKHPVNDFKATVRMAWTDCTRPQATYLRSPIEGWDFDGDILLSATFVFPRLGKHKAKKYGGKRVLKTTKPDLDNLLKSLQDALNGLAFNDDSQIAGYGECWKWHAADGEVPHVSVTIETLNGKDIQ
jgi:Holliday junction resolvase RusA-like endonuclease